MPNNWLSILCKTNTLTLCVHIARSLVVNVRSITLHFMTLRGMGVRVRTCASVCVRHARVYHCEHLLLHNHSAFDSIRLIDFY